MIRGNNIIKRVSLQLEILIGTYKPEMWRSLIQGEEDGRIEALIL